MKILFIAEASSGLNKHFYKGNTLLFHTVKKAFEEQFGSFESDDTFLNFFKELGCALEHLCIKTISKESAAVRAAARRRCIPSLAERIKAERPQVIIILMKSISDEVHEAIQLSGVNTVKLIRATSYPSISEKNRLDCIAGIRSALNDAVAAGILSAQA